jgi:UDP-glucose 4-epimerase
MKNLSGKKILIFGGSGSLGQALIKRLHGNNELCVYSRDEAKHWTIKNDFKSENLQFLVGDIRDLNRVEESIKRFRPNIIIIASALKQVDTCELSPFESIQTNIIGINNIVDSICRNIETMNAFLETVLMVSTDKACAPVNIYGMCKAIAERVVTSKAVDHTTPKFVGVRYGNVLESRGSIIPLFRHQAMKADAFTVTHEKMTRYLMTLDDSIDLIIDTVQKAKSGEIWLPKLRSMSIIDLAEIFSKKFSKPIKIIGMRPGEKLHEDLISEAESVRVQDIGSHYVLSPAHEKVSKGENLFNYTSGDDVMSKSELESYLNSIGILDLDLNAFPGKHIEEIRTS